MLIYEAIHFPNRTGPAPVGARLPNNMQKKGGYVAPHHHCNVVNVIFNDMRAVRAPMGEFADFAYFP